MANEKHVVWNTMQNEICSLNIFIFHYKQITCDRSVAEAFYPSGIFELCQ